MRGHFSGGPGAGVVLLVALLAMVALFTLHCGSESSEVEKETAPLKGEGIVITIVYDNNPFDKRLETAWGFACVIEGLEETVLFDTGGDGRLLLANMAKCGIKPEQISAVVLSHIHGDHTGGLSSFLDANSEVKVYLPKSFPSGLKQQARKSGAEVIETVGPCRICEGAWTTGVLGRGIEEQGFYLEGPQGLIVITGCAHPGVVQMAKAAKEHAGMPVHAVMGGFHMGGASQREIEAVITGFRELGVRQVAPCHCSGQETRQLMKEAFSDGYLLSGVGARLVFHAESGEQ